MINRTVEFTITKREKGTGVVLDKVQMLNKRPPLEYEEKSLIDTSTHHDYSVVTGYLIQDSEGKLHSIQYWRIVRVFEDMNQLSTPENTQDSIPHRDLEGGYKREGGAQW